MTDPMSTVETEQRTTPRDIDQWDTVAVTALPAGWRNVYRDSHGRYFTVACPAILVQELREKVRCTDTPGGDGTTHLEHTTIRLDPPYETRTVFADNSNGGSTMYDAEENANYVQTIGPGDPDPSEG